MKFLSIALLLIAPMFAHAQGERDIELEKKIKTLESRNKKLFNELKSVKENNYKLENTVSGMSDKLQSEITKSQELQAQNERALNLALDEFSRKFEKQNETVKGVQDTLDSKFNKQLIYFVIALVAVVIIFLSLTRSSTQKALKQNIANWNDFQTNLLKK